MARTVELWVGATDDSKPPPRVRLRVWDRCGGRCHRCTRKIPTGDKWVLEHLVAIINGGHNAEDNMGLSCSWCVPAKNGEDLALKSKVAEIRKKHLGAKEKRPWNVNFRRKLNGQTVRRITNDR